MDKNLSYLANLFLVFTSFYFTTFIGISERLSLVINMPGVSTNCCSIQNIA